MNDFLCAKASPMRWGVLTGRDGLLLQAVAAGLPLLTSTGRDVTADGMMITIRAMLPFILSSLLDRAYCWRGHIYGS